MLKRPKIYIYSSFPILDTRDFFSRQAIAPLTFKQRLHKDTLLPIDSGFPNSFLLMIEHELSLNSEVHIHSSFLNEKDYSPIRMIAKKYKAEMYFSYLETDMKSLFEIYKKKNGVLSFPNFLDKYVDSFILPYKNIKKISFEHVR